MPAAGGPFRRRGELVWHRWIPDVNSTHYSDVILTRKEAQQGIPTGTQQIRDRRLPKSEKTLGRESLLTQRSRVSHFMFTLGHFTAPEPKDTRAIGRELGLDSTTRTRRCTKYSLCILMGHKFFVCILMRLYINCLYINILQW